MTGLAKAVTIIAVAALALVAVLALALRPQPVNVVWSNHAAFTPELTVPTTADDGRYPAARKALQALLPDRITDARSADEFAVFACSYLDRQHESVAQFITNVPDDFEATYPGFTVKAAEIFHAIIGVYCPEPKA